MKTFDAARRVWCVRVTGGRLVLATRPIDARATPLPVERVARLISALDPRRPDVRATFGAIARSDLFASTPHASAGDRVVSLVRVGRLHAFFRRAAAPTLRPEYVEPDDTSLPASEVRTWIEIELVDMNDQPVPGQAYRVELPDGRVRTGSLDRDGRAREEGLVPGTCKVSFPKLDGRAWRRA